MDRTGRSRQRLLRILPSGPEASEARRHRGPLALLPGHGQRHTRPVVGQRGALPLRSVRKRARTLRPAPLRHLAQRRGNHHRQRPVHLRRRKGAQASQGELRPQHHHRGRTGDGQDDGQLGGRGLRRTACDGGEGDRSGQVRIVGASWLHEARHTSTAQHPHPGQPVRHRVRPSRIVSRMRHQHAVPHRRGD